jgi:hypothetical protein
MLLWGAGSVLANVSLVLYVFLIAAVNAVL